MKPSGRLTPRVFPLAGSDSNEIVESPEFRPWVGRGHAHTVTPTFRLGTRLNSATEKEAGGGRTVSS